MRTAPAAVTLVLALVIATAAHASQRRKPSLAAVTPSAPGCAYRVIEGDMLQIAATGEMIRAAGHDAPAISYAACKAERALGRQALARTIALYTGARRSDLIRLGRPHVHGDLLRFNTQNGTRYDSPSLPQPWYANR